MPKKKVNPYALSYPKTPNPLKEMSYCHSIHAYVSCDIEAFKVGGQWEMGKMYRLVIKQGDNRRESDYIYTKEDIVDAIYDTYRFIYERNYGKERKESGD